jgi:hypothetical protein
MTPADDPRVTQGRFGVVASEAWPRSSWIERRSPPRARRWVAKEFELERDLILHLPERNDEVDDGTRSRTTAN